MEDKRLIYFLSDAHLGSPDRAGSLVRERKMVAFLEGIRDTASDIFIMGDLFDFWFEYKAVVPRGFTRILGKLSELADSGIRMHFFTGNHDIWTFDYLAVETGMKLYTKPTSLELEGKRFFLAHGDGMDESDHSFRILKWMFTNRFLQWAFARLHPNLAFAIARRWSGYSRMLHGDMPFREENEPAVRYARKYLTGQGYDFIVLGHRHCPVDYPLDDSTRLIILGDWISHFSYAVFDGQHLELKKR